MHVSSFLEGPTLASGARPDDPGAVARLLVRVYLGAPRGIGLVLANPRASDVVLLPGGGIGLIGPGAARAVEATRTDVAVRALEALRAGDEAAFASAAADLGVLPVAAARTAYGTSRGSSARCSRPARRGSTTPRWPRPASARSSRSGRSWSSRAS